MKSGQGLWIMGGIRLKVHTELISRKKVFDGNKLK